jgi:hypothetical protein
MAGWDKHRSSNREYWMIYRGLGFLPVVWFGTSPIPYPQREGITVYRVPECLSLRLNCMASPIPFPAGDRVSPLFYPKGGQHLLAGDGMGDPTRTTRQKAWHSVYSVVPLLYAKNLIYLFVFNCLSRSFGKCNARGWGEPIQTIS